MVSTSRRPIWSLCLSTLPLHGISETSFNKDDYIFFLNDLNKRSWSSSHDIEMDHLVLFHHASSKPSWRWYHMNRHIQPKKHTCYRLQSVHLMLEPDFHGIQAVYSWCSTRPWSPHAHIVNCTIYSYASEGLFLLTLLHRLVNIGCISNRVTSLEGFSPWVPMALVSFSWIGFITSYVLLKL